MPGNVPNISDDTFNFIKEYAKVVLQQGVPITDADWNELQDIIRLREIRQNIVALGNCRLAAGASSDTPGFVITGTGASNNFTISGGLACADGVIVPSQHGVSEPGDIEYDSSDNYMMEGTVSSVGGGNIVDEHTFYSSFMNVVNCRIRMTSGTESGNDFVISVLVNTTTLTLSGGTGTIAPGDTYLMLPPELTTPGTVRVDQVYIQAWFDDINAEEDTDLLNPALGLEPSHRSKLRSCVRVAEGGVSPSTPDPYSTGVRYLNIGYIERNVSDLILPWFCFPAGASQVKSGLGGTDFYTTLPMLVWRNMGRKSDAEVDSATFSIYQWQDRFILVRGGYLEADGHVFVGTSTTYPVWFDTDGFVKYGSDNTPGADLGQAYLDDSTWDSETQFASSGPIFKGGEIAVHNTLALKEGSFLQLEDDAHLLGDPTVLGANPMKMFGVDAGHYSQIHYNDSEIWWTLNTTYDRATGEFTSVAPISASFLVRFIDGGFRLMYHAFSYTAWTIGEWTNEVIVDPLMVHAKDFNLTRELQTYIVGQERVFSRRMGFLAVRLHHTMQGKHVALFRTEENDTLFEMISGNSGYFSINENEAGRVNVYPEGSDQVRIQNKLTQQVDIGYGYIDMTGV